GDALLGLASSGPHANGYSLIRRVLQDKGLAADAALTKTLLAPTRIYARPVLALLAEAEVHGMAHITGGGFLENVPRMLANDRLGARVRLDAWPWPDIFNWLQQAVGIEETEMLRTFNCGIGFVLCVPADEAEKAMQQLEAEGERVFRIGEIVPSSTQPQAGELILR
ncbi:MAG: phosphoribosylformylglycinamidine cyclo-ligase, partial [Gammaproteobacteria bacterium]|nr:phosphoribosylformylglycinamidine cyclo-ligase [Gammaproteobacteria bacterium]